MKSTILCVMNGWRAEHAEVVNPAFETESKAAQSVGWKNVEILDPASILCLRRSWSRYECVTVQLTPSLPINAARFIQTPIETKPI